MLSDGKRKRRYPHRPKGMLMENYTNDCRDQMLAMRKHIESNPEIMAAAYESAFHSVMSELAFNPDSKLWGIFEGIVNGIMDNVTIEDAKRIAPVWRVDEDEYAGYELISCALEEIMNDYK